MNDPLKKAGILLVLIMLIIMTINYFSIFNNYRSSDVSLFLKGLCSIVLSGFIVNIGLWSFLLHNELKK